MITHHKVDGYENYQKLMQVLDGKGKVVLYLVGSPNPSGSSWCPDCNLSGPVISKTLKQFEDRTFHFVQVGIGTIHDWRNPVNPFKTDKKIQLKDIPTLLIWRTEKVLIGPEECSNEANLQMLFDSL